MSREEYPKYNATGNYWGKLNAIELDAKGDHENLSFIFDYYDDMEKSQIIYDKWKKSPNENVGYQGEGFLRENLTSKEYSIGDTGPAGGIVFYDKGFYSDGWRYLEAAPSDIGEYAFGYYRPYNKVNNKMVGTAQPIGSGRYNTEKLVEYMDIVGKAYSNNSGEATYSEYAAKKCLDYSYGEYDDWFLPSRDELCEMYKALRCPGGTNHGEDCPDMSHAATSTEDTRNSFDYAYWSSSEYKNTYAWYQYFYTGDVRCGHDRFYDEYVRAVRAF